MEKTKRIIQAYMALEGVNQEELASILGITRQTLNKKINGHLPFKDKEKVAIAGLFKTDVSNIFFINKGDDLSTRLIV